MVDSIIEQASRGIARKSLEFTGLQGKELEAAVEKVWKLQRDYARAAIASMLEPTPAMLGHGWTVCDASSPETLAAGWRVMIETALAEKT